MFQHLESIASTVPQYLFYVVELSVQSECWASLLLNLFYSMNNYTHSSQRPVPVEGYIPNVYRKYLTLQADLDRPSINPITHYDREKHDKMDTFPLTVARLPSFHAKRSPCPDSVHSPYI